MIETDPTGKNPKEAGAKLDLGKPPVFRGLMAYFPNACKAVSLVSLFGAEKYSWAGWETVPDGKNRYADALARHLLDEAIGDPLPEADKRLLELLEKTFGVVEPELAHAAQEAWNAMAKFELILKEIKKDDRPEI